MATMQYPWYDEVVRQLDDCQNSEDLRNVLLYLQKQSYDTVAYVLSQEKAKKAERLSSLLYHLMHAIHNRIQRYHEEDQNQNKSNFSHIISSLLSYINDLQMVIGLKKASKLDETANKIVLRTLYFLSYHPFRIWDVILQTKFFKKKSELAANLLRRFFISAPTNVSTPKEYMKLIAAIRVWRRSLNKESRSEADNYLLAIVPPKRFHKWLRKRNIDDLPRLTKDFTPNVIVNEFLIKKLPKETWNRLLTILSFMSDDNEDDKQRASSVASENDSETIEESSLILNEPKGQHRELISSLRNIVEAESSYTPIPIISDETDSEGEIESSNAFDLINLDSASLEGDSSDGKIIEIYSQPTNSSKTLSMSKESDSFRLKKSAKKCKIPKFKVIDISSTINAIKTSDLVPTIEDNFKPKISSKSPKRAKFNIEDFTPKSKTDVSKLNDDLDSLDSEKSLKKVKKRKKIMDSNSMLNDDRFESINQIEIDNTPKKMTKSNEFNGVIEESTDILSKKRKKNKKLDYAEPPKLENAKTIEDTRISTKKLKRKIVLNDFSEIVPINSHSADKNGIHIDENIASSKKSNKSTKKGKNLENTELLDLREEVEIPVNDAKRQDTKKQNSLRKKQFVVPVVEPEIESSEELEIESLEELEIEPLKEPEVEPPKEMELEVEPPKEVELEVEPPKEVELEVEPPKEVDLEVEPPKVVELEVEPPKVVELEVEPPKVVELEVEPPKVVELEVEPPKVVELEVESAKVVEPPKEVELEMEPPKEVELEEEPEKEPEVEPPKEPEVEPPKEPEVEPPKEPEVEPPKEPEEPPKKPEEPPKKPEEPSKKPEEEPPKEPHAERLVDPEIDSPKDPEIDSPKDPEVDFREELEVEPLAGQPTKKISRLVEKIEKNKPQKQTESLLSLENTAIVTMNSVNNVNETLKYQDKTIENFNEIEMPVAFNLASFSALELILSSSSSNSSDDINSKDVPDSEKVSSNRDSVIISKRKTKVTRKRIVEGICESSKHDASCSHFDEDQDSSIIIKPSNRKTKVVPLKRLKYHLTTTSESEKSENEFEEPLRVRLEKNKMVSKMSMMINSSGDESSPENITEIEPDDKNTASEKVSKVIQSQKKKPVSKNSFLALSTSNDESSPENIMEIEPDDKNTASEKVSKIIQSQKKKPVSKNLFLALSTSDDESSPENIMEIEPDDKNTASQKVSEIIQSQKKKPVSKNSFLTFSSSNDESSPSKNVTKIIAAREKVSETIQSQSKTDFLRSTPKSNGSSSVVLESEVSSNQKKKMVSKNSPLLLSSSDDESCPNKNITEINSDLNKAHEKVLKIIQSQPKTDVLHSTVKNKGSNLEVPEKELSTTPKDSIPSHFNSPTKVPKEIKSMETNSSSGETLESPIPNVAVSSVSNGNSRVLEDSINDSDSEAFLSPNSSDLSDEEEVFFHKKQNLSPKKDPRKENNSNSATSVCDTVSSTTNSNSEKRDSTIVTMENIKTAFALRKNNLSYALDDVSDKSDADTEPLNITSNCKIIPKRRHSFVDSDESTSSDSTSTLPILSNDRLTDFNEGLDTNTIIDSSITVNEEQKPSPKENEVVKPNTNSEISQKTKPCPMRFRPSHNVQSTPAISLPKTPKIIITPLDSEKTKLVPVSEKSTTLDLDNSPINQATQTIIKQSDFKHLMPNVGRGKVIKCKVTTSNRKVRGRTRRLTSSSQNVISLPSPQLTDSEGKSETQKKKMLPETPLKNLETRTQTPYNLRAKTPKTILYCAK